MPPVLQQVSSHRPVVAGQEGFGPGGGSVPVDDPRNQWPNFAPPGGNEAERDPSTSLEQTLGHQRGRTGAAVPDSFGAAQDAGVLGTQPGAQQATLGEAVAGLIDFGLDPVSKSVQVVSGKTPIGHISEMLGLDFGNESIGNMVSDTLGLNADAIAAVQGTNNPAAEGSPTGAPPGDPVDVGTPAAVAAANATANASNATSVAAAVAAIGEAVAAATAGGHGSGGPGPGSGAGAPAGHGPGQGTAAATGTGGVGAGAW